MAKGNSSTMVRVPIRGSSRSSNSHFRVMVVGDDAVGKTCLIRSYATNRTFPYQIQSTRPTPTQYPAKCTIKGEEYTTTISDAMAIDSERRTEAYTKADVVIICYSLIDEDSLKNVKKHWIPEVRLNCPNTPIMLVGTMSDLVQSNKKRLSQQKKAQSLVDEFLLHSYAECSALTKDGVPEVYSETFEAARIGPVRFVAKMKSVKPQLGLRDLFRLSSHRS